MAAAPDRPLFGPWPARMVPLAGVLLLLVVLVGLAGLGSETLQRTVTDALIKLLVVIGLYIFVGNSGVMSFGHTAFMAIGAYVSAWLTIRPALKAFRLTALPEFVAQAELPVLPAAILAGLAASAFALVVGTPLMRLSGISAAIGTFAMLAVTISVLGNWDGLTGGSGSLIGVPIYTNMWIALAWSVVAIIAAFAYQTSRFGQQLRASREDEVAAKAAGTNVRLQRLIAFSFSAFFVAIGGVLQGHFLGILSVDAFFLRITFITLAMLVVGGMNSLAGAVVGVAVISIVSEALRQVEGGFSLGPLVVGERPGLTEVVLALVMLAMLILRPAGITGGRELSLPRFLSRRVAAGSARAKTP